METENRNPFGNSVAIVKGDKTDRDDFLIAKIAIELVEKGTTGGLHIFDAKGNIANIRRSCESIIFLWGRKLPIDILVRLQREKHTPMVQLDLDGNSCVLDEKRKFQTGDIQDICRMDLLPKGSSLPYAESDGERFWIRNLSKNNKSMALVMALRIADIMSISRIVIGDKKDTDVVLPETTEQKPHMTHSDESTEPFDGYGDMWYNDPRKSAW